MVLSKIIGGSPDTGFSSKLNGNSAEFLTVQGLSCIRQLIDRTGVWSKGLIDGWGEAYVDADGREGSVTTTWSNNESIFVTNKYVPGLSTDMATGDTTHDPDSFSNVSNAFDGDADTYADKSASSFNVALGKTFSARYVYAVRFKAMSSNNSGGANKTIYVETYDGGSWNIVATFGGTTESITSSEYVIINDTVQGIRIRMVATSTGSPTTGSARVYVLQYSTISETEIEHTIPSGTFSSTISKSIGVPLISDYEAGIDIQYKLTNATEDTGWLNSYPPEISSFTAFTSQPTKLIVKLIPKSSSPTSGYPSIRGFWVRAT